MLLQALPQRKRTKHRNLDKSITRVDSAEPWVADRMDHEAGKRSLSGAKNVAVEQRIDHDTHSEQIDLIGNNDGPRVR